MQELPVEPLKEKINFIYNMHKVSKIGTVYFSLKYIYIGASLVVQWLRICLPMQGTRVQALVWEDPTCRRATRPVSHNY